VIYPARTFLEEIGHARVEQQGARKLYHRNPEGRSRLTALRATAEAILDALSRIGGRMEDIREAFVGANRFEAGASDELHRARDAMKNALHRKRLRRRRSSAPRRDSRPRHC
jgi:DNA-binding PadR family transcriptional regulator